MNENTNTNDDRTAAENADEAELRTDGGQPSDETGPSSELRTDGGEPNDETGPSSELRTDGGAITPADDDSPSFRERKERTDGLSRLTYEYFERSRREDQVLRDDSDYVERDVLGFPAWPHEMIRNLSITSFFVGVILFVSATMPPPLEAPANPTSTPAVILPDWYLYWSFGILKTETLNLELAILGGQTIATDRTFAVLLHGPIIAMMFLVPFLNKGSARRPVEQPFWSAVGVFGVILSFTLSLLAIKNLMATRVPILTSELQLWLSFALPFVGATITYAVLKSMREGYMYDLNRRYYRLRPPR